MIKRLVLKNYRIYDNLDMTFGELELIKGRNGIGKTSIVEAIGFALFGSALQRGKAGSWVKKGEKDGAVLLHLDDAIIERSTSVAIVYNLKGDILARNNVGITEWVQKTYGLTPDLYKTSFFIGQKDIGSFAALSPLERTKRVEKLLRIDKLDEIKDQAKERARQVQAELHAYQTQLENAPYNKFALETAEKDFKILKKELAAAEEYLEEALIKYGKYEAAQKQWARKQKLEKDWKGSTYDIAGFERLRVEILEKNAEITKANNSINEKLALEKKLSNVNVLEKYFNNDIEEIMNHKQALQLYKKLKSEYDNLKETGLEARQHNLYALRDKINLLEETYKINKTIPEICPTCGQEWPEKPSVDLSILLNKIITAKNHLKKSTIQNRLYELEQQMIEPALTEQEIEDILTSLKYKNDYLRYKELWKVPKEPIQLHTVMELETLEQMRKQNDMAAELEELENIVEPESIDIIAPKNKVRKLQAQMHEATDIINKELEYQKIAIKFSILVEEYDQVFHSLKEFIKFIDKYRKAFGNNVIPLLEKNVSDIVNYLTEGKYTKIKINPDYGIEDFEFYSGSEQDSINFALRLSIAQISKLGSFKTMLLDEIAASFDTEKEKLLLDVLKQQSNQLIYITHGNF